MLLLDEPTSSLSPHEAERLFGQVRALAASGVAIIYISHRIDEVAALCHRVVVMRDGQVVGEFAEPRASSATSSPPWRRAMPRLLPAGSGRSRRAAARDAAAARRPARAVFLHPPAGEILGLFGLVGAGRTTIARTLVGDIRRSSGEIVLNGDRIFPGRAA